MMLACFRGSQAAASALIEATIERGAAGGQAGIVTWARWAAAVLYNGLGRYPDALVAARQASEDRQLNILSLWALPELVEAAVRTGDGGQAGDALSRLAKSARAGGTDWGLGTEARRRTLLTEGAAAEPFYQEAIGRLGQTRMRPMLARTHLLYGEWLRRELPAAGGTTRKRAVTTTVELTAQEAQIARLAADGLSNPEIGTRLFLSPRIVQFHQRKVFIKLDITSRAQLSRVLSGN
jgi:DNA-binding CsgD family transcriptional regulator